MCNKLVILAGFCARLLADIARLSSLPLQGLPARFCHKCKMPLLNTRTHPPTPHPLQLGFCCATLHKNPRLTPSLAQSPVATASDSRILGQGGLPYPLTPRGDKGVSPIPPAPFPSGKGEQERFLAVILLQAFCFLPFPAPVRSTLTHAARAGWSILSALRLRAGWMREEKGRSVVQ